MTTETLDLVTRVRQESRENRTRLILARLSRRESRQNVAIQGRVQKRSIRGGNAWQNFRSAGACFRLRPV